MALNDILFYLFALVALVCGALAITRRNPVNSAMFLVLTIVSMAGLFVLLHAFFLAAVQVLVYAGAIMVLFLFVIMFLDLKTEERHKIKAVNLLTGLIATGAIVVVLVRALLSTQPGKGLPAPTVEGTPTHLGKLLFTHYLLPVEMVGLLFVVAIVGAILFSKKDSK